MTIRPLSSRVIFVAPRNMTRQGESRPFPPTFSHWAPLWNRGRTMSIQNSEKFVAFTKTYVEALMSGTTVSQSREAHSVLTISGLPNELYTVVRRKLRRCGASGLERMLDPLDARRGAVRVPHHDDVEAHRQLRQLRTLLQERSRGACDALLFAPVDARRRAAVGAARTGAHLGDHQHAGAARDEVELAEPAQVVALQDLEAARAQEFGSQLLGASSALLSSGEHRTGQLMSGVISQSRPRRRQQPQLAVVQLRPVHLAAHAPLGIDACAARWTGRSCTTASCGCCRRRGRDCDITPDIS